MDFSASERGTDVPPIANVVPVEQMAGDDEEDTTFLQEMLEDAKRYVLSFPWCDTIEKAYFAGGVGKIFAVFLFKITSRNPDVPSWEWIIVGDIPPAYIPLEDCRLPREVFETYIDGMRRWVEIVREGREPAPEDCVPPINVPATTEWAENLSGRLRLLVELIQPHFS